MAIERAAFKGPWPISALLAALVVAAVLPVVTAAAALVWRQAALRDTVIDEDLQRGANVLALALDREMARHRTMLEALAESDLIDAGNWEAFHAYAKRVTSLNGAISSSLFTPDGRQVLNTLRPPGAPVPTPFALPPSPKSEHEPRLGDTETLKRVFATGKATHSDIYRGIVAKRLLFTVDVPVVRDGKVIYALNAGFEPKAFIGLIDPSRGLAPALGAIVDRNGFFIARAVDGDTMAGKPAAPATRAAILAKPQGTTLSRNLEGTAIRIAWSRTESGWTAAIGLTDAEAAAAVRRDYALAGGFAALGVLLGLWMALLLGRRLRAAIVAVASESAAPSAMRARELEDLRETLRSARTERDARISAEARKEEAEASSRAKDAFIATLAHELRNPLAPIRNAVALLKRQGPPDPQLMWARDVIERQANQLTRLVEDLLDIERINLGRLVLRRLRTSLQEIVDLALEAAGPHIEGGAHRFALDMPTAIIVVDADKARLAQAISNLLINAAKYTASRGTIKLVVRYTDSEVEISVHDTGTGFEATEVETMFRPFSQLDRPAQDAQSGLGIGLALVKSIVEMHGGTIGAYSDGTGRGSRFTIRMAASKDQRPPALPAADAAAGPSPAPLNILLVDDNTDAARSMRAILQLQGHRVEVAFDGESALSMLRSTSPHIGILDIGLPDMNGYALARAIREKLGPSILLVALTGWGQAADQARAYEAGFDLHFTKPVDPVMFCQDIYDALRLGRFMQHLNGVQSD